MDSAYKSPDPAMLMQAHQDSLRVEENRWVPLMSPTGGNARITAGMRVHGDGEKVIVEVDVADDSLEVNNGASRSNHVEIWFGLPDVPGDEREFDDHDDSYQRIYRTSAPRFLIFHPARRSIDGFEVPPIQFVNDSTAAWMGNYCESGEDSVFRSMSEPAVDFFGTVHYGLFPDNRPAVLYDAEKYGWFEKSVNAKLSTSPEGIEYKVERRAHGYLITATFPPEALRFVRVPEMSTISLMVDVMEDHPEGSRIILSSSPLRRQGERNTFNLVTLYQPLATNRTGAPSASLGAMGFNPVAYHTPAGWRYTIPAAYHYPLNDIIPEPESVAGCIYDFSAYFYLDIPLEHSIATIGGLHLDKYAFTDKYHRDGIIDGGDEVAYIYRNIPYRSYRRFGATEWNFNHLQTEFTFADGTPGIIVSVVAGGYMPGQCGGVVELDMGVIRLAADSASDVIGMYEHPCVDNGVGESAVGEKTLSGYQIRNVRWEKVGRTLVVECASEKKRRTITITFDPSGRSYRIAG